jgi:hypothetical protein
MSEISQRMKRRFIESLLGILLIAVPYATAVTLGWIGKQTGLYVVLALAMLWAVACEWRQSRREKA